MSDRTVSVSKTGSSEEIQAIEDYQAGRLGFIPDDRLALRSLA